MSKTTSSTTKSSGKKPTKAQLAMAAKIFPNAEPIMPPAGAEPETAAPALAPEEDNRSESRRTSDKAMEFAVQQLSAPIAPTLTTPPVILSAFEQELAALQAKHGIPATAVKVKVAKTDKIVKNDITRPAPNTLCGTIWATADQISQDVHGVCPVALLKAHPSVAGINAHTIKTQYARWRQFNGISGRLPTVPAVGKVVEDHHE